MADYVREIRNAIAKELRLAGAAWFRFERGTKHPRVVFQYQDQVRYCSFSARPSSSCTLNVLQELRRMLGRRRECHHSASPRRKRRGTAQAVASAPPVLTVRPDPFARLKALLEGAEQIDA